MNFGWIEWNEKEGPEGAIYADGRRLPTLLVRRSYIRPDDERWNVNPAIDAVFPLENGLSAWLLAEVDHSRGSTWLINILLWPQGHDDIGAIGPDVQVDWKTGRATPIPEHKTYLSTYGEDPEDVEGIFDILKRWSSLELVKD